MAFVGAIFCADQHAHLAGSPQYLRCWRNAPLANGDKRTAHERGAENYQAAVRVVVEGVTPCSPGHPVRCTQRWQPAHSRAM